MSGMQTLPPAMSKLLRNAFIHEIYLTKLAKEVVSLLHEKGENEIQYQEKNVRKSK